MAVRNFYLHGLVDGRQTPLTGGPIRKDGGMKLVLTQRCDGEITEAVKISCWANGNDLYTDVEICGVETHRIHTSR